MIPISVVVTAPHGISRCLVPPELFAAADGKSLELVFADADENYVDQSRPGLQHVSVKNAGSYSLVRAGLGRARMDWIFLLEDHVRPMPGLLEAYRAAIADHPDADLLFGGVENVTSVSSWSCAQFLYAGVEHWPPARMNPRSPSAANLLVRRRALLASELLQDGGFEFGAIPRLTASGRALYCPGAVVDHVRWFTLRSGLSCAFHSARSGTATMQQVQGGRVSPKQMLHDGLVAIYGFSWRPWRVMRHLRGTAQGGWILGLRMVAIGLSRAAGMLWAHVAGPGASAIEISASLAPKGTASRN